MKYNHLTKEELVNKISELEARLAKTQWLHQSENPEKKQYTPFYGDVTELNTERTILDTVGKETLKTMTSDLMDLLDTSVAIYEKNGDYAYGVFNSGWCQLLDASSRKLCNTDDNKTALRCGKWLCHNDCWNNSAKAAILARKSSDIDCIGAIKLYAEPIFVGDHVIGAINIGYGNPPIDDETLQELSEKFGIDFETLKQNALSYKHRPDFIIEIAKKRLKSIAKLIGEIVSRKQAELKLRESEEKYRQLFEFMPIGVTVSDNAGKVIESNKIAERLLGISKDEHLKRTIDGEEWKIIRTDGSLMPACEYASVKALKEQKLIENVEMGICKSDKDITWISVSAVPRNDRSGVIITYSDITKKRKAEKALKESERKYRTLFENSLATITFFDDDFKLAMLNEANANLLGGKKEDFIGKSIYELFPDVADFHVERFKKIISSGKAEIFEDAFNLPNGTKWFSSLLQPIYDTNQQFEGIQIISIEITEKKQAEQALKESERNYQILADSTFEAIFISEEGICTNQNKKAEELFGYSLEEAIGNPGTDWIHPDYREMVAEQMKKQTSKSYQCLAQRKDGSTFWAEIQAKTAVINNKRVRVTALRDITDRKQAEQALKESEAKYKILFEQSTVGLAVTDARGNIINANEKLCQMLNYSKEELLTKKVNEISHPDDMAKESELAKDVLAGEKCDIVLEKRYITKDNRIVWGFLHTRVIRGGDKNIDYIIGAVTDITELKQAEEKLQEYAIELEKANVTKDRFISILGHDLRTPFNSIIGFSDLLQRNIERYDKEKIKQFVNNISKTTNQTFNLLENLLEWSRCQRDKIPFNPQFVDVFNLVYEPYGIVLGSAEAKQIAIDIDVPATIKVFADIEMIKTVIRNLLSNAIKFTPENGEINISAKALTRAVQISVSDTGTGMNEKIKNSLFKIGETVTVEGTNGERGSGLGLLLCKEFVEKHGGEIRVESREGKGSEFAFTLPLHSIP